MFALDKVAPQETNSAGCRTNVTATRIAILSFLLIAPIEITARHSGIVDFPKYHVDDQVGYIPEPNQSGSFLHTHAWVFNDRSMGTESPWDSAKHPNVLLIGNSVVMGGNPYDQKEKLGPMIQQRIGNTYALWPIAAGGWTTVNEMVYLDRNPDVAGSARYFFWEYMGGGLSDAAQWHGDYVFASKRPLWASWYTLRRYAWPRLFHANMSEMPPVGAAKPEHLSRFEATLNGLCHETGSKCAGILFLYPKKAELMMARQGHEWLPERTELERIADMKKLPIVDISGQPDWNVGLYRGDGVHPTVQGNAVLARILSDAIQEGLRH